MKVKCEKCGSKNVIIGKLTTGSGGLFFTSKLNQSKLLYRKKYSLLIAKGCRECGAIFDIKMENPHSIIEDK